MKEGQPPVGPDQLAIDKATADRVGFEVGDQVAYVTDTGRFEGTISATVGLGDTDGFGGASIIALDLDTALDHFGADGKVDAIDIGLAEGADSEAVRAAIEDVIPDGTEVVTGAQVAEENADGVNDFINAFGTGLLIFAFITAFVSAFIINNVFQITIGQRMRELALMRAVGASGRQVRRMITVESFILGSPPRSSASPAASSSPSCSSAGFNAAGAGFPSTGTVMSAAHGRDGGTRRHRHHDGYRRHPRSSGGARFRRSRRCAPSSGSTPCRPGASSRRSSSRSSAPCCT